MVDEWFVTVGSITWSMDALLSRKVRSESRAGGNRWWMQLEWWIAQFLKEITTQFVTSIGKRRKVSIVKCRPIGHRCCNGINNAESSSLDCLNRLWLILFNCLHHLLSDSRGHSVISRLRTYEKYHRVFTRTTAPLFSICVKSLSEKYIKLQSMDGPLILLDLRD